MDWYLEAGDLGAGATQVRRELDAHLRRHADEGEDVDGALLVAGELLSNALVHAGGPTWVSLTWAERNPELTVADLGPGFDLKAVLPDDPLAGSGRGLYIATQLAVELSGRPRPGGGMVMRAVLPVARRASTDHDPPRRRTGVLPLLDEAEPGVGFGKLAFLRALVVQLARVVEDHHGPDAAEAAVAQVGADVGGQMEAEYRQACEVVGRMSPAQMGECYVRLKHAIDGGFSVLEATPERVVLVNDRCPFGEVVRASPSLCRMTSSVFGGIAARNTDHGATVVLEERIAVGDPTCRVVVWLDPTAARFGGHHYRTPVSTEDASR